MYRVLAVDDEPAVHEDLKLMVNWEAYGFSPPSAASNCIEALAKIEAEPYHLIILDIQMPGMTGLECLEIAQKKSPESKFLILSGYQKFSYAKEAMRFGTRDYLLKPIDRFELMECLGNLKRELDDEMCRKQSVLEYAQAEKNQYFMNLVTGVLPEEALCKQAAQYNIALHSRWYCVALAEIENYYDRLAENLSDARNWRNAIQSSMEQVLKQHSMGCLYDDSDGLFGMLLYHEKIQAGSAAFTQCLEALISAVYSAMQIHVVIGYGRPSETFMGLKASRKEAFCALEQQILASDAKIIPYSDEKCFILQPHVKLGLQTIFTLFRTGDTQAAALQIAEMTAALEGKRYSQADLLFGILFGISESIRCNGGNPDRVIQYSDMPGVAGHNMQRAHLNQWIYDTCREAVEYTDSLVSTRKMPGLVDQVISYLKQHYKENPSIKEMGRLFFVNSAYLGQLFRREQGVGISTYLNQLKIASVKQMVFSQGIPVTEAIENVGYSDSSYFYKKFKQYEGMSFAHYKRTRNTQEN